MAAKNKEKEECRTAKKQAEGAGEGKKGRLILQEEPDWLMEAVYCLSANYILDSEEWLKKKDTLSEEEKRELIAPYIRYRDEMRRELFPFFEKYPLIMKFIETEVKEPEALEEGSFHFDGYLMSARKLLAAKERPGDERIRAFTAEFFAGLFEEARLGTGAVDDVAPVRDLADVLAGLENLKSDSDRYRAVLLYTQCIEIFDALRELKEPCARAGRSLLPLVEERLERFRQNMEAFDSARSLLSAVGCVDWSDWDDRTDTFLTPGIVSFNTLRLHFTVERELPEGMEEEGITAAIDLGLEMLETIARRRDRQEDDRELLSGLKAISDPTRLKILRILARESRYLQELSRELSLTPATVSHHLSILMERELVTLQLTTGKKRVYYRVEPEKLARLGEQIIRLGQPEHNRRLGDI